LRVAVYHNNSDVRIEQRDRPRIGDGELLLRVEASGICGSDLMEWYRVPKAPLVLGHEVAGTIEEVGAGVKGFVVGDRVVATHHVPCMSCRYCATDRHSCCETLLTTSFEPGGFSELVRLPGINVDRGTLRLPDKVTFEEGSFVEPLACVVRGQRMSGFNKGDAVVVLGSGVSGILHIQLARARGAGLVVATDVSEPRLAAARRFGADLASHPGRDPVESRLRDANDGRLAEQVIVCTGARAAFDQALGLVDRGGTIMLFAPLEPDETWALPQNALWRRGISLVHSYAGPPADMAEALRLIEDGVIDVASMVTHRLDLDDTEEGFRLMAGAGEALKVIVEPNRR